MLNINIDDNKEHQTIAFSGDTVTIASEISMAIWQIYNSLKNEDQVCGAVFRAAIQRVVNDESPIWDPADGTQVTINLSKRPGGGADRSE